jgi:hypothetical protein
MPRGGTLTANGNIFGHVFSDFHVRVVKCNTQRYAPGSRQAFCGNPLHTHLIGHTGNVGQIF